MEWFLPNEGKCHSANAAMFTCLAERWYSLVTKPSNAIITSRGLIIAFFYFYFFIIIHPQHKVQTYNYKQLQIFAKLKQPRNCCFSN